MYYTYLIRSLSHPNQTYVGFTHDLKIRIAAHNAGGSAHTSKFLPWQLEFYAAFRTQERALAFEHYLNSHSGHAFAKRDLGLS